MVHETPSWRPEKSYRIVIVEDDDEVRRSLSMLLGARGFQISSFASSEDLLTKGAPPDTDCLLVDYKMGSMNGLDLLRRLRTVGVTAPALMITGYFSNNLSRLAQEAGYRAVIEKPPSVDPLLAMIQTCVQVV